MKWKWNLNPNKICDVIEDKKKALKLKEKGNDAFKRKKYKVAENFYSEALKLNLDSRPVWTNRAICRNTMQKHDDALTDCFSALSIDPHNTKKGIRIMRISDILTLIDKSRKLFPGTFTRGQGPPNCEQIELCEQRTVRVFRTV